MKLLMEMMHRGLSKEIANREWLVPRSVASGCHSCTQKVLRPGATEMLRYGWLTCQTLLCTGSVSKEAPKQSYKSSCKRTVPESAIGLSLDTDRKTLNLGLRQAAVCKGLTADSWAGADSLRAAGS